MKKLSPDFEREIYGLHVRLVNEDDAEFILKLRTNERLSQHIHSTVDDLETQKRWIREYKKREAEGREYYFIYSQNKDFVGVNRISNIFEYYGLGGSWLCSPDNDPLVSMTTPVVGNDICFDEIQLDYIVMDVRKANKHVWKFHESVGAIRIGESSIDYYYYLYKDNYYANREKFLKLLNVK